MTRQGSLFGGPDDVLYRAYQEERARVVPGARLIKMPPTNSQRALILRACQEFASTEEAQEMLLAVIVGTYGDHPEPRLVTLEKVLERSDLWQLRAEKGAAILAERAAPAEQPTAENRENVRKLFGVK